MADRYNIAIALYSPLKLLLLITLRLPSCLRRGRKAGAPKSRVLKGTKEWLWGMRPEDWPVKFEQDIYHVDDPAWGLRPDAQRIKDPETEVKHVTKLVIEIPQVSGCKLRFVPNIPSVLRRVFAHWQVRLLRDGLYEKLLFEVHPAGKEIRTEQDEQECMRAEYVLYALDSKSPMQAEEVVGTVEDAEEDDDATEGVEF